MSASTPSRPWADGPMKLVTTPQYKTGATDLFTVGATHMALAHNSIIRSFNSIYRQAPHVSDADKSDFINYALTWHRLVTSHHSHEELALFPKVEDMLDDKSIWTETHKEHDAFLGGLAEFAKYLNAVPSPSAFSGSELLRIMDSFKPAFEHHFHHEIDIIAALRTHKNAPKENSPEAAAATAMFKAWGKKSFGKAEMADVVPLFLLNLDLTAEDGRWSNWPPMPAPVRWMVINVIGTWYGNWWKFASCDASGQPVELYALRTVDHDEL